MKRQWLETLRCPTCRGTFHVDATREAGEGGAELIEGFLLCRECLGAWPVIGGSAVLVADLRAHWRAQGSVYRRIRLSDPRVTRYVLAGLGAGVDVVPFEEVTAHYGDLVEDPALARERAPEDEALDALLTTVARRRALGRTLDLGCGVGRSTFLLAQHGAEALGVDRSAARVRRARNLAATSEPFYVGAPQDARREVPLALERLTRATVDFAVVDPTRLPVADQVLDGVLDHGGDGHGAWADPEVVRAERARVLRPGGWIVEAAGPLGWRLLDAP